MKIKEIFGTAARYRHLPIAVFNDGPQVGRPNLRPVEVKLFEVWQAEKLVQHVAVGQVQVLQVPAKLGHAPETLDGEDVTVADVEVDQVAALEGQEAVEDSRRDSAVVAAP